jgi:nucleoside-diphosphate-sugar epimerase
VASRISQKDWLQALITTEQQLDDVLSRPSEADSQAMQELGGDLIVLGAGGKMGPTLAMRARRAADAAGVKMRVIAVSRYSSSEARRVLDDAGIETLSADILDPREIAALPDAPNVMYMAGRKFGSTGGEALTWAMNAYLPALVCEKYQTSRIVAFSSGNVYPFLPIASGGATENTPVHPVGEYAQSALGRERMFEYFCQKNGTPVMLVRLNYAVDLRYGVLLDIGAKVFERKPVDLTMGAVNILWQGDANSIALRAFALTATPAAILNVTGPETLSVRHIATRFGEHFGTDPVFTGAESNSALLNNAARCFRLFGYPTVSVEEIIEWTARWIGMGGSTLNKPTHFEARDGKF